MIYLYAITEELEGPLEALRGVDYAPLSYLHRDGLTAVVSEIGAWGMTPAPRRLWQHEQVVEALMTDHSVLPVRFATIFPDEAAVLDRLDAFGEVYQRDLDRLRGCVELSLRVIRLWEPYTGGDGMAQGTYPELVASTQNGQNGRKGPASDEKNGRTYDVARRSAALQRQSNRRRNESLGEIINRSLQPFVADHTMQIEETAGVLIKAAYLVSKENLGDMQQAVRRLMRAYPNLHFLCTGPWPPYHFISPVEPVKKVA